MSPNGSKVFVSGVSTRVSTGLDQMVVAYRADNGRKLWSVRHDRGAGDDDVVTDMAIAPNGRTIFVTGTTRRTQTYYDYYTVAYGTGFGAVRWTKRYDGPAPASLDDYDAASAITVSPDGARVYVTGESPDLLGGGSFPTSELRDHRVRGGRRDCRCGRGDTTVVAETIRPSTSRRARTDRSCS